MLTLSLLHATEESPLFEVRLLGGAVLCCAGCRSPRSKRSQSRTQGVHLRFNCDFSGLQVSFHPETVTLLASTAVQVIKQAQVIHRHLRKHSKGRVSRASGEAQRIDPELPLTIAEAAVGRDAVDAAAAAGKVVAGKVDPLQMLSLVCAALVPSPLPFLGLRAPLLFLLQACVVDFGGGGGWGFGVRSSLPGWMSL